MVAKNEITGDKLQSKLNNKQYEDNFDRIFGKKNSVASTDTAANKSLDSSEEWDEKRVDVIGSNGNDGLHYPDPDQAYQQVERDYNENPSS